MACKIAFIINRFSHNFLQLNWLSNLWFSATREIMTPFSYDDPLWHVLDMSSYLAVDSALIFFYLLMRGAWDLS